MYLSRLQIRRDARTHPTFRSIQTSRGYVPKKLVWAAFGDREDRDRDFIYRPEGQPPQHTLYAVAPREPDDADGLFSVEAKPYEPTLSEGQPLVFKLRANATVHKDGQDHDVVMNAKWEIRNEGAPERSHRQIVQEEGLAWLADRGPTHGFAPVESATRIDGYEKVEFESSGGGHQVVLGVLEYTGQLTVTDPEAFREMLFEGLGPSKAYGCGMMIIRPIRAG